MEQVYQWDEKYLAIGELPTSYFENSSDKGNPDFLKTIPSRICVCFGSIYIIWLEKPKNHPSLGMHSLFFFKTNSVNSPGKNSQHGDFKTPTRIPALYPILDIEDNPSKTPGTSPTRMLINSLPSRRASREKFHNTPSSRMKSIWRLSKEIFWSQPQHMAVNKS